MTDHDSVAPGVQADVHLTTSLAAGDVVDLAVARTDGSMIAMLSAPVAADGSVTFAAVSVPSPRVVLSAEGRGLCGIGRDEVTVDVAGGSPGGGPGDPGDGTCTIALSPVPEDNAFYAPLGVLSSLSDPDAAPGYQAVVHIATQAGWTAELFEARPSGMPAQITGAISLGMINVDAGGAAVMPVTVQDGEVGFYAVCHGPPGATDAQSAMTAVVVDTTVPACGLIDPLPGTTLTRQFDADPTMKGVQPDLIAHADGTDVEGEPVRLTFGAAHTMLPAPPTSDAGISTVRVPFPAGAGHYDFALQMRDHAGNVCDETASYDVEPNGCDIKILSPTTVTEDADHNPATGSQADLVLDVSKDCANQRVTADCGVSAPSGFADFKGSITLRAELCTTSPCQTTAHCTFKVTRPQPKRNIPTTLVRTITFDDVP